MPAPQLDQAILLSILHYDPDTGIFTWRHRHGASQRWNTRYAGKVAGFDWKCGPNVVYRSIRIFDWPFLGHRLAVLYMTGEWPVSGIDHRDLDGLNNRWGNLRPANKSQNGANTRSPNTNTSGFKGVSLDRKTGRYRAYIKNHNRQIWLGYHDTPEAAHAAYMTAATALRGDYARSE